LCVRITPQSMRSKSLRFIMSVTLLKLTVFAAPSPHPEEEG